MTKKPCPIEPILGGDLYTFTSTDTDHSITRFSKYKGCDMWHQVTLHHEGKYEMTDMIDAIFEILAPNDFYPCYYRMGSNKDTFYVRNSYDQLELLFTKKLQVPMTDKQILCISLKMKAAAIQKEHVNPTEMIQSQISICFNLMNKVLDLSYFANNQRLQEIVLRMSVPRILTNILSYASRKHSTNVEMLKLNGNGLKSARGMHPIIWMKSLKEIDLRDNCIKNTSDLNAIPKATIVEMWLEGNPLCSNYSGPSAYIIAAKGIIPTLVKLDGHEVSHLSAMLTQQNFLCHLDGYELVEQFIEHYFTCFDSLNRCNTLRGKIEKKMDTIITTHTAIVLRKFCFVDLLLDFNESKGTNNAKKIVSFTRILVLY